MLDGSWWWALASRPTMGPAVKPQRSLPSIWQPARKMQAAWTFFQGSALRLLEPWGTRSQWTSIWITGWMLSISGKAWGTVEARQRLLGKCTASRLVFALRAPETRAHGD